MEFSSHLTVALPVNGRQHNVIVDARTTLLDLFREHLELTGTKKGCNFGECGAFDGGQRVRRIRVAHSGGRLSATMPAFGGKAHIALQATAYHPGDASLTGFATNDTIGTRATMTIGPTIVSRCVL
jgi:xanthine dehydrogenase YagT iron-sulfur-binding subunit